MQGVWDAVWPYLAASLPTIGVAFLFYWVVRYMIQADRSERQALAKWNLEHGRDAKTPPEARQREFSAESDRAQDEEKPRD
ncbi:lysyl-tRNA synthetase [Janibacter sp. GXQ6167]|uniref:lysyl-tRNA synthetase n=1 Tax=Janibacter sp. GXQ6167 TaxID=3240791 RepID=UPI0035266EE7